MFLPAPRRLDEGGFERLLDSIEDSAETPDGLDLRALTFIDPQGLLGVITIGASRTFRRGRPWGLKLPEGPGVLTYLDRSGGMKWLERYFIVDSPGNSPDGTGGGRGEPPLLEVASIRDADDVHRSVARVKGRTDRLLVGRLGYNALAADRFTVAVAEVCQNIVDHSESEGFVAAQYYPGRRGRSMLRLAVSDRGIGVRKSLAPRYARERRGDWDDRAAVRLAFQRWVSRFAESGRGLGLKLVAEMVRGWGGRLLLRSGTAAYAICPNWGPRPRRGGLAPFPGTQINIFLPGAHSES